MKYWIITHQNGINRQLQSVHPKPKLVSNLGISLFVNPVVTESDGDYRELRVEAYPDFKLFLDARVKQASSDSVIVAEGQKQEQDYYTACLAVKAQFPKS